MNLLFPIRKLIINTKKPNKHVQLRKKHQCYKGWSIKFNTNH